MSNLKISPRALQVVYTSIQLFDRYGFHKAGIDFILQQTKIAKMTFYNNFQSKERFIEICMTVQKERLKQEVRAVIYSCQHFTAADKLREIYLLHADLNSPYHLLFKAIFEIEQLYPTAYQVVLEYREWLVQEILELLSGMEMSLLKPDVDLFLFMIDGAMVRLLCGFEVDQDGIWSIFTNLSQYN
ncbi:TetR/AcrR family transcriptional regulator [Acinetobacter sp. VNH17]|uniref:TetR/AcrR family transcriptional regulator n=1 Tax=Acinetobacter thutiue TaxID=2998078 RepID=A0ABT7WSS7_9GAMM|nr:TetR/AcrR family transcriptional regulator [Acinetobacter thutiue]MCY6413637.1 TetR/AcrR family transcriptional regulator [Acinetobacter thutiue]MDN0015746.1 TetR/AcrR family transcriptional regulator [Acinetobacter thutiue]